MANETGTRVLKSQLFAWHGTAQLKNNVLNGFGNILHYTFCFLCRHGTVSARFWHGLRTLTGTQQEGTGQDEEGKKKKKKREADLTMSKIYM